MSKDDKEFEAGKNIYKLGIERNGQFHLVVENKELGVTMSVIPMVNDSMNSIEVLISNAKTGDDVESFAFGPSRLKADEMDESFWEEFADRYAVKFANLKNARKGEFKELVFPDIMEVKNDQ